MIDLDFRSASSSDRTGFSETPVTCSVSDFTAMKQRLSISHINCIHGLCSFNLYALASLRMCPALPVSVALLFSISHFSSEMLALRVWCESGPSLRVSSGATLSVSSLALLPLLKGPGRDDPKLTGFSLRSRPVLPRLTETYRMKRYPTFRDLNSKCLFLAHLFSDVGYLPSERLESDSEFWAGGRLG